MEGFAFSGVHVISPQLLRLMCEQGVFSIIDTYVRLASQGQRILAFPVDQYYWRDLGKPENVLQAQQDAERGMLQL
jgi:NDP-sugar pyrophosphorylase family protein